MRKTSAFFMVLAVLNLIVALIPPSASVVGAVYLMKDSDIVLNGKQVGPEFDKLVAQEAPMAKIEAFATLGGNVFACLLLIAGSVCLFMSYSWGRWACVAGALIMILSMLVHDVYQIFFYRPALMTVIDRIAADFNRLPLDQNARNLIGVAVTGLKGGMTVYTLAWSCTNPIFMLYLFVMALCMAFMTGYYETGGIEKDAPKSKSGRGRDDDDEDEDDEEEDERPAPRKKKKARDEDDDD